MQKVYILCGLIGAGKSTWANKKASENKNLIIISKDSFRSTIKGDKYIYDIHYEDLIKKLVKSSIKIAIENGFDIIIDETNLTEKSRKEYIDLIEKYTHLKIKIIIVYFTENTHNIENRMKNCRGVSREIWTKVFNNMKKIFEPPSTPEIPIEGGLIIYGEKDD